MMHSNCWHRDINGMGGLADKLHCYNVSPTRLPASHMQNTLLESLCEAITLLFILAFACT